MHFKCNGTLRRFSLRDYPSDWYVIRLFRSYDDLSKWQQISQKSISFTNCNLGHSTIWRRDIYFYFIWKWRTWQIKKVRCQMALAPQFITSNSIKWQQIRYVFNIFAAALCIKMITHAKKWRMTQKLCPPRILQIIHSRNAVKWRTAAVVGASSLKTFSLFTCQKNCFQQS